MLVKKTRANQITIPKSIIKNFKDIEYFDVYEKDGVIILVPVEVKKKESVLSEVRKKIKELGITEADINEAIKAARSSNK